MWDRVGWGQFCGNGIKIGCHPVNLQSLTYLILLANITMSTTVKLPVLVLQEKLLQETQHAAEQF